MSYLWSHPSRKSLNCCLSHSSYFLTWDIHCANQKKRSTESAVHSTRGSCVSLDDWMSGRQHGGNWVSVTTDTGLPPHLTMSFMSTCSRARDTKTCHSLPWSLTNMCLCIYIFMSIYVHTYVLGSAVSIQCLHCLPLCVWRQGLSLNLVLTDSARSAGQRVHGIPLFLSPLYLLGLQVHTITLRD